ncbi:MAG TPA: hypothetical protein VMR23_16215 [Candidatus Limnocylindria bacterium]|nr:hypothetical protein [Candidatus Limnocylindria bacterium]
MIKSFLTGVIAGGVAVWMFGDQIRDYVDDVTHDLRGQAAAGLEGAAERLQSVADTVEEGLAGSQQRVG